MGKIKTHLAKEKFFISNSVVKNNLPPAIPTKDYLAKFGEIADVQFGFFDSASPDYSTYFPDISQDDLMPKDEDFYMPLVRAISKVILNKYGPIDFSEGSVLENSLSLLERQTLYGNHEVMVGNEVGVVFETAWQSASESNGVKIPAGINARLKIDGKSNPRLVRGMQMDPPSIHSFSVGVSFMWEPSHPKLDDNEFWRGLGTYGEDKQLIRRIVKEITAYHELSLVPHGADPYAQIINEKGINNSEYARRQHKYKSKTNASAVFHFTEEDFEKMGTHINYKDLATLSLSAEDETIPDNNQLNTNSNSENQMNELEQFLASLGEVEGVELSEGATAEQALETIRNLATNLASATENVQTLTSERDTARTELADANSSLEAQKPTITAYEAILEASRKEAVRLYKLAKGDKASTDMLEMIAKADTVEGVNTFVTQFREDANEKFTGKCKSCGSTDVARMSTAEPNGTVINPESSDDLEDDDQGGNEELSVDEALAKLKQTGISGNASAIHGKNENNK